MSAIIELHNKYPPTAVHGYLVFMFVSSLLVVALPTTTSRLSHSHQACPTSQYIPLLFQELHNHSSALEIAAEFSAADAAAS